MLRSFNVFFYGLAILALGQVTRVLAADQDSPPFEGSDYVALCVENSFPPEVVKVTKEGTFIFRAGPNYHQYRLDVSPFSPQSFDSDFEKTFRDIGAMQRFELILNLAKNSPVPDINGLSAIWGELEPQRGHTIVGRIRFASPAMSLDDNYTCYLKQWWP